jgi:anti-sigma factor RsiW
MTLHTSDWELLHRAVDGEANEAESSALEARLAREPELAAAHRALLGVGRTLSEVGLVDPPPDLVTGVMRRLRPQTPSPSPAGWLTGWAVRRPVLALASTLALGLAAGVLVGGLSGTGLPPVDPSSVLGTLLPSGAPDALPVVDEARIEEAGIRAAALVRRGPGVVVAELEILSEGPVDVSIEVDPSGLRPSGFECLGARSPAGVVIEAGEVWLRDATSGRCFVSLAVLRPAPGPVAVRVRGEMGAAEASLRVARPGE